MVVKKYHTSIILFVALMTGCASFPSMNDSCGQNGNWTVMSAVGECIEAPKVVEMPTHQELKNLPAPEKQPIVAVYAFPDKTGQRKQMDGAALFSTAVTQGGETMLIDALKTAGNGSWFIVVERVGIDHITRERQIVRSTREQYDEDKTGLAPLLFAGMVLEGGIIGFDTNIKTGGHGASYLGIGAQQAYRRDIVVVHLRAVSTLTGEVLLNVQTSKTILHVADGFDVFKFVDMSTKLVEIEDGTTENESITRSVRSCIEQAVLEMIYQGHDKGYWEIKEGHRHPHQANGKNDKHPKKEVTENESE